MCTDKVLRYNCSLVLNMLLYNTLFTTLVFIHYPVPLVRAITPDFIIEEFTAGICRRGTTDTILSGLSYSECVLECRARSQCVSLGYKSRANLCRLNFDGDVTTTDCTYYSYTEKSTWTQRVQDGCEGVQCDIHQKCEVTSTGPVCVNSECKRISRIENGVVFGNDVRRGKRVAFVCNRGYELDGSNSSTCTADGWSDGVPVCTALVPEWTKWSPWSECAVTWSGYAVTCGSGTRLRSRTCTTDPTMQCEGLSEESEDCTTSDCPPSARTCAEWASIGLNQSADVQINPVGTGNVTVYCDFDLEPGKAVTVLHHNQENRTHVNGYETCFTYSIELGYVNGLDVAIRIADLSTECKQYVKWECYHIYQDCVAWVDRLGNSSTYFTGAPPPGKYCACGETDTCDDPTLACNCFTNDAVWRMDDGYITDKNALPITRFLAGDTGTSAIKSIVKQTIIPLPL